MARRVYVGEVASVLDVLDGRNVVALQALDPGPVEVLEEGVRLDVPDRGGS